MFRWIGGWGLNFLLFEFNRFLFGDDDWSGHIKVFLLKACVLFFFREIKLVEFNGVIQFYWFDIAFPFVIIRWRKHNTFCRYWWKTLLCVHQSRDRKRCRNDHHLYFWFVSLLEEGLGYCFSFIRNSFGFSFKLYFLLFHHKCLACRFDCFCLRIGWH